MQFGSTSPPPNRSIFLPSLPGDSFEVCQELPPCVAPRTARSGRHLHLAVEAVLELRHENEHVERVDLDARNGEVLQEHPLGYGCDVRDVNADGVPDHAE